MIGIKIRLFNGVIPRVNLTGIQAIYWDAEEPVYTNRPPGGSPLVATDSEGDAYIDLSGVTELGVGDYGFLTLYQPNISDPRKSLAFMGRVQLSEISAGTPLFAPPTDVTAAVDGSDITITIGTEAVFVDGYHYYQQIDGGAWTKLNATATTDLTYTLTPTESGEYNFRVTSVRGTKESAPSAETLLVLFYFAVNDTQTISGQFSTTGEITVHWGDGTSNVYNGTDQVWSKDYGSAVDALVVIEGADNLTKFVMDQSGADISFDLKDLPSGLTYFRCIGSNTVSGFLADLPSGLTYFRCSGSNTISGSLADLPSGLTYFYCEGSNTVSGSLADLPSGLTNFRCRGSNTVSGFLADLPSGLTYFYCSGSNTISGSLADLPSGLTYFRCIGSNTVSGSLADLPSALTTFDCEGSNTVSGSLADLPSGLTNFRCRGLNTIDTYVTKTWTTKPATFILVPVSPGGLSETEINQLLVDLDEDLDWSTGTITLTGTNAAPTGAGLTAIANMAAEGATITVNS